MVDRWTRRQARGFRRASRDKAERQEKAGVDAQGDGQREPDDGTKDPCIRKGRDRETGSKEKGYLALP